MTITGSQAIRLALIPGQAETLEDLADRRQNFQWKEMAREVKVKRNTLYFCLATAIIGIAVVEFSSERSPHQLAGRRFLNGCATGLAILTAKKLYEAVTAVQRAATHLYTATIDSRTESEHHYTFPNHE